MARVSNHLKTAIKSLPAAVLIGVTILVPVTVFADDENEAALDRRLARLERVLDSRGLVEMSEQLDALTREIQELRGQLEEQVYTIEQLRKSQRQAYVDIDQRVQRLELGGTSPALAGGEPPLGVLQPGQRGEVAGTPAPEIDVSVEDRPQLAPDQRVLPGDTIPSDGPGNENLAGAASDSLDSGGISRPQPVDNLLGDSDPNTVTRGGQDLGAASGEIPTDISASPGTTPADQAPERTLAMAHPTVDDQSSEAAYREAFNLLKAGQYDESIAGFSAFLLDYPNSQYADNAQYWLGETYFVKQAYEPAIVEYQKLVTNFPRSKKQSHAMLKIGYSYHKMGELGRARGMLDDLRKRFPGTTAARLAAERIQQIDSEAGTP